MKTAITVSEHHENHRQEGHFERPDRLLAIQRLLQSTGMLDGLSVLNAPQATEEDILLVHPESYYRRLVQAREAGTVWLDPDTYSTPHSLHAASEALGGLLEVTRAVASGDADNGFAAVRPPGHHARPHEAMGFCLLANVAIAARWVQKHTDAHRIAIVDFDVHHGNGTQEIFYEDPDVLYISTHQSPLYPGTGSLDETGDGNGKGATINIPLPARTGDATVINVFEQILRPRVLAFNPDFVFLSAGYDAHWLDPIGGMNLTLAGFAAMTREVQHWAEACAGNRLVGLLEGGYHLEALAHGVLTTLKVFNDPSADIADPLGSTPDHDTIELPDKELDRIARFHAG